jgi:hypothetical protein
MTADKANIAQTIAGALERAAAASPQSIPVRHLIDTETTRHKEYLGARLCGLALYWLNKEQGIPVSTLAKAIKTNHDTVASRLKSAAQLKLKDPWQSVYDAIRHAP